MLISGRGSNMSAVARACREGRINAQPSVVIADRADAGGLAIAQALGIKTAAIARNVHPDRETFEHALDESLLNAGFDLIVLAGFMRILSPEFTARHAGRTLNIHPSLLPNYRGLHTHRRVLEAGDKVHGASVHFVTAELDGGPVVLQSRLPVLARGYRTDAGGSRTGNGARHLPEGDRLARGRAPAVARRRALARWRAAERAGRGELRCEALIA